MDISKLKKCLIHVIPSFACNLNCGHCDVKHKTSMYKFDEQKFFETFDKLDKSNSFVFFGGEPLLNSKEMILRILNSGKITSMTSNFLLLDDEILEELSKRKIAIGTSWNPDRMTDEQYEVWKEKIKLFKSKTKKGLEVFITLTDDLLDNNIEKLKTVLSDLDDLHVNVLQFSMVIPTNPGLVKKADDFFCNLMDNWPYKYLRNRMQSAMYSCDGHKYRCRNRSWTLYPDGSLDNHCTHNENPSFWNGFPECKTCEFYGVCSPCPKQPCCSFYKKFYLKLAKKELTAIHKKRIENLRKRASSNKK